MPIQPDISIIIPTFNDAAYLAETLQSLDDQTYRNFEIILVDDASTDADTLQILNKLSHPKLRLIQLESNSGPAVARNRGIEIAKGKYILPLDADDKIAPTYLEKAKQILDEDNHIGIVYCEAEFFGDKTGKWELPAYSFPEILVANMIFATGMYRKEDWKSVGGYNENMRQGNEDYDFWLSILELGREVHRIPEVLFYYRIKGHSRTTQLNDNPTKEIDTYEQIFHNHQKLYLDNIRVLFEELHRRQAAAIEKTKEIQKAHQKLQSKDEEIRILHQNLQTKDKEIASVHKHLKEQQETNLSLDKQLHQIGEELGYAREIIAYRDQQIEAMRLKNRAKKLLKKLMPFLPIKIPHPIEPQKESSDTKQAPYVYRYHEPKLTESIKQNLETLTTQPLISLIMPVYNVDPKWLDKAIRSVEAQWYHNWELCIADDKSDNAATLEYLKKINNPKIRVRFLESNLNISGASNAALELATGEYIALMDNDDEITPDALYEVVKKINEADADFIYSDEDFIDTEGNCANPHFKPDFSPDLLLSHNYITHFACFKRSLLDKVGYFNSAFDGSQDYDLFLRLTEQTENIIHIPKVLYHWRTLESSTSVNAEAKPEAIERGRKVLEAAMKRRGIDATVEHGNLPHYFRVKYTIKDHPLVSIVIPFKDKPELLEMSVNSVLERSTYQNYEIIGISNNSQDPKVFELMQELEAKDSRVKFYEYNTEFNYADINNHAVNSYAKGEHILLLNNDIEVISPDWIEAMLEHSQREEIGCVGAKLYYPNDTIQHAGVIIGLGGYAGHSHKMYPRDNPGYFNRLNAVQNVSAVTAACLMIKKSLYQQVGGMDAVKFKVAYNDVDFCLRVMEAGYRNLFTPYAQMYHHESISRGYETTPEKIARFQTEKDALFERHRDILTYGDPYYNPNLTHDKEDFSLCIKQ